jgi:hypothetical protein
MGEDDHASAPDPAWAAKSVSAAEHTCAMSLKPRAELEVLQVQAQ